MSELQEEVKTAEQATEIVVSTELKNIVEALIFASDEPMTVRFIRSIMDDVNKDLPPEQHFVVNAEIIRKCVGDLNRGYGRLGSGFRIIEIAGGFTYATQEQFSSWVGKLAKEKARRRLSPTAVETLAIIAYKQPIAKGEVEFIRGVNVDYIINALLEKDLIHITGRANTPGRPLLYGTTQKFLEHFGLNDLSDLPKPREISELINETEAEVDRRLLAEQQELEFKEDLEKKLEGNEGAKNKPQRGAKMKAPEPGKTTVDTAPAAVDRPETVSPAATSDVTIEQVPESGTSDRREKTIVEGALLSESTAPILETTAEAENETIHAVPTAVLEPEPMIDAEPMPMIVDAPDLPAAGEKDPVRHGPIIEPGQVATGEVPAHSAEAENERSAPDNDPAFAEPHPTEEGIENGWSKWKNKVKTFFRKLFA